VQLKIKTEMCAPGLRRTLATAAAGLLASGHANAQEEPVGAPTTTIDSALLAYHEVNRVQAIEPEFNVSHQVDEDSTFSQVAVAISEIVAIVPVPASSSASVYAYGRGVF
jgi:hypothetical protein